MGEYRLQHMQVLFIFHHLLASCLILFSFFFWSNLDVLVFTCVTVPDNQRFLTFLGLFLTFVLLDLKDQ